MKKNRTITIAELLLYYVFAIGISGIEPDSSYDVSSCDSRRYQPVYSLENDEQTAQYLSIQSECNDC